MYALAYCGEALPHIVGEAGMIIGEGKRWNMISIASLEHEHMKFYSTR
jgi:hypothetical protein